MIYAIVSRTGADAIGRVRAACLTAAVLWGSLRMAIRRTSWPRTVREQIGKQILFTGYEALGLTSLLAVAIGISVVAQGQLWLTRLGQSDMLGTLLVVVIFRELGPLLVNVLVVARSGTAIVTELATMRVRHEVSLLEEQGVDPMCYLVMPRMLGVSIAVFCLTMYFIAISLATGFLFSLLTETGSRDAFVFLENVLRPVQVRDFTSLLVKTLLSGLLTGVICCIEGLTIRGVATEVPQAATRAVVRSITAILLVSALVSVLTYM
jgi:phospholipid/cholesterol/gamma-HCH transport system permease protein